MTDALATARKRFKRCKEAEEDNRRRAEEADKFSAALDQWPEDIKREREQDARPCLTMDETNQYINQVKNDQRQNRASIKVRPVDDKADKKVANMFQGVIRHIEDASNADVAYDTGFEHALRGGFGYWRVYTDYCYEDSFEQELKIGRIRDRFSVYLDPDRQEPDGSDSKFGFVTERLNRDDFKRDYPKADLQSWEKDRDYSDWIDEDTILIADYYFVEETVKTLVQLPDGTTAWQEEIPEGVSTEGLNKRQATVKKVIWQKINGNEVLEETEWMGKYIPIVEVIGNESEIEGKRRLTGMVYPAMDGQRMHNYAISAMVEGIALAPKSPNIAAEGQLEGHEQQWQEANRRNIPVLLYKPISLDGVVVPPPQRQPPPGLSAGWADIVMASRTWIQSSMGMYNASVGAEGNEKSGRAILAKQREGETASFHYLANLALSIRHTGRILIDMIPKVYDTKRIIRILGEDGQADAVMFDPMMKQGSAEAKRQDGSVMMIYNPTVGKYDVSVATGPSYSTKRQEAAEAQMQLVQAAPEMLPLIGDIMIRNMDWPQADKIADRLKAMLPPQIKALEEKPNEATLEAKMAQLDQASQALEQKAHTLFQKEQQLTQAEQVIQEAGQTTAKERSDVEAIKNELESLKAEIDASRRILSAEKATVTAQIKLAQNESTGGQDAEVKRYEADMKYQAELAKAAAEIIKAQIAEKESAREDKAEGVEEEVQPDRLEMVMVMLDKAVQKLSAPKQIIFDESGNPVGIETMQSEVMQ